MKKILSLVLSAFIIMMFSAGSCKKPKENIVSSLTIQTAPSSGSNQAPAPGPDFPLVVTITSTMPTAGVRIDVTARAEGSVNNFFSTSVNSNSTVNNFVITGSPQGVTSVVDVTVTNLADASVRATASYRFARK